MTHPLSFKYDLLIICMCKQATVSVKQARNHYCQQRAFLSSVKIVCVSLRLACSVSMQVNYTGSVKSSPLYRP